MTGRRPSGGGTCAAIGRRDPALAGIGRAEAVARCPGEASGSSMGRRRLRRPDPADAARALPEAIAALSRTLPAAPSPETFRRAKFDHPEAVRPAGQAAGR